MFIDGSVIVLRSVRYLPIVMIIKLLLVMITSNQFHPAKLLYLHCSALWLHTAPYNLDYFVVYFTSCGYNFYEDPIITLIDAQIKIIQPASALSW